MNLIEVAKILMADELIRDRLSYEKEKHIKEIAEFKIEGASPNVLEKLKSYGSDKLELAQRLLDGVAIERHYLEKLLGTIAIVSSKVLYYFYQSPLKDGDGRYRTGRGEVYEAISSDEPLSDLEVMDAFADRYGYEDLIIPVVFGRRKMAVTWSDGVTDEAYDPEWSYACYEPFFKSARKDKGAFMYCPTHRKEKKKLWRK